MWIGISRVKNEADIIEAFVRHSTCHLDKLIIIDHASTDRTAALLASLIDEGLPLEVHHSDVFESQGDALTRLMRRAFLELGADWVVPLDADEFVEVADGTTLRESRRHGEKETLELHWENFMYVPEASDGTDPLSRMLWRSSIRSELPKVVIPRTVGVDPDVVVYEGSHFIARRGKIVRGRSADGMTLCHFPIRSLEQYRLKVIVGTLRYIVNPSRDGQIWGWHYRDAYNLILADRLDELEALMREESLRYSAKHLAESPVLKPFERLGGNLRYTTSTDTPSTVASLAGFAEKMAKDLRDARKRKPLHKRIQDLVRPQTG